MVVWLYCKISLFFNDSESIFNDSPYMKCFKTAYIFLASLGLSLKDVADPKNAVIIIAIHVIATSFATTNGNNNIVSVNNIKNSLYFHLKPLDNKTE